MQNVVEMSMDLGGAIRRGGARRGRRGGAGAARRGGMLMFRFRRRRIRRNEVDSRSTACYAPDMRNRPDELRRQLGHAVEDRDGGLDAVREVAIRSSQSGRVDNSFSRADWA
ncbi:MAG: hypothetical protein E6J90_17585 [Deltaproteobacteria bacterium]|nr:MAG: hypothetical protein E6J91_13780 [Deltaproteobacteria bacterium]TMQ19629.1 MAG: hypothetical protein E6J90_17585 [Deltaproteobacteria bacterium]